MDPASRSWSALPSVLFLNICNHLDSRLDHLRFRAVCSSWCSVLPPPKRRFLPPSPPLQLPCPLGPFTSMDPSRCVDFFKLTEQSVYFLQPLKKITDSWRTSKCWLIRIEDIDDHVGKVRLMDTLCRIDFPKTYKSGRLPKALNLLDYRVSEVTKMYGVRYVGPKDSRPLSNAEKESTFATKVAVCYEDGKFAIMVIHNSGQLSFWREGLKKWIHEGEYCYNDVVYRNGKFYATDASGLTIAIDLSFKRTLAAPAVPNSGFDKNGDGGRCMYLVNSVDGLFLLYKSVGPDFHVECNLSSEDDNIPVYFNVYKLNEEISKWVPVKSLGDRVIFVCSDGAFTVSAKDFPVCKKNCIYFEYPFFNMVLDHPAALFDIGEGSANMLSSDLSYSGLFWPPPSWIKCCASASGSQM